jgi:tetratricopeptide (TPR) repeat protein
MLSFISDAGRDLSSAVYYVDDVLVARDRPATLGPMVAPGRRRFFADRQSPGLDDFLRTCPAVESLAELGLGGARLAALDEQSVLRLARGLEAADGEEGVEVAGGADPASGRDEEARPPLDPETTLALRAIAAYRRGCDALERGRFEAAATAFADGAGAIAADGASFDEATALLLGWAHALVALERWPELDRVLGRLETLARDPRYALLAAFALARTGDPAEALACVEPRARLVVDGASRAAPGTANEPRGPDRGLSQDTLRAAEATIALLRAAGRFDEARAFAEQIAAGLAPGTEIASRFHERAGQIAFAQRDLPAARAAFERARDGALTPSRLLLALADVAWLEGDYEQERRLREGIYGRLRTEE